MSFFKRKAKQKESEVTKQAPKAPKNGYDLLKRQQWFLKFNFPDELSPKKNSQISNMINTISSQEDKQENKLEATFPYASFKTADELLTRLRDYQMKESQNKIIIEDTELLTWNEKNDKKTMSVTVFEEIEIDYHFKTILAEIFEQMVNDGNATFDADTMIGFMSDLKASYAKNANVKLNTLPEVPNEQAFLDSDYYKVEVPSSYETPQPGEHEVVEEEPNENTNLENGNEATNEPTDQDPTPQKESTEDEKEETPEDQQEEQQGEQIEQGEANAALDKNQGLGRHIDPAKVGSREVFNSLLDDLKEKALQTSSAVKSIETDAPQFSISNAHASQPYEPTYVEYMLNLKKEEFNTQLKSVAQRLNSEAENSVLDLQRQATEGMNYLIKEAKESRSFDVKTVKSEVQNTVLQQKKDEADLETKKIVTNSENDKNLAEQEYKAKIANIERNEALAKQRLDHELSQKYAQLESEQLEQTLNEKQKTTQNLVIADLKPQSEKVNSQLAQRFNEIRLSHQKTLQAVFRKLEEALPEYEQQLQTQYLNAVESHAVEQRAQDIGLQNQNVIDLNKRLNEQNQKLIDEKDQMQHEIEKLTDQFNTLNAQLAKVPDQNKEQTAQIQKQMANLKTELTEKNQKQKRLNKEILAAGVIVAALGIGTGGVYAAGQHDHVNTLKTELKNRPTVHVKGTDKQQTGQTDSTNTDKNSSSENESTTNKDNGQGKENSNVTANDQSNLPEIAQTLPDDAKKAIQQGNYQNAISNHPELAEELEQSAFESGDLQGVKAVNEQKRTTYGTIDEAILQSSPNLIVAAYETNGTNSLGTTARVTAVGRAYLKRNYYNEQQNDFLSAVKVYQSNMHLGQPLYNDLQTFEKNHSLN